MGDGLGDDLGDDLGDGLGDDLGDQVGAAAHAPFSRFRPLLFLAGLGFAATWLALWAYSPLRGPWDRLDLFVFEWFNSRIADGGPAALLFAVANQRAVDLPSGLFFGLLMMRYVVAGSPAGRGRRLAEIGFIVLFVVLVLHASNEWLPDIKRYSPTLVVDGAVRLSELVPWVRFKDASRGSFPGDHGTALILFTALIWHRAGWRSGLVAAAGSLALVWPRLASGAHWATDITVGSVALGTAALTLALATPLASWVVAIVEPPARWLTASAAWRLVTIRLGPRTGPDRIAPERSP